MSTPSTPVRPTRIRHIVLWLTVGAYLITYMDRVVISSAVPSIQKEFGFDLVTMGWVLSAFQWAYALFQIPGGWLGDRFGPRRALSGIVLWWSLFTSATTLAWSATSMAAIRFLFGMGEAGAFPIATRSLSRWMLPSERGYAQGITHAGARLGAALTPALVVLIIASLGWRSAFVIFGAVGVFWSALWFWYYRDFPTEHASVNAAELELIQQGLGDTAKKKGSVPWGILFSRPQMWLLSSMYFCYAYSINLYLVWYPKYLNDHRGFNLKEMGIYASLPLLAGVVGDLLGGTVSDIWAKRSGDLKMARRGVAVFGFSLAAVSVVLAALAANPFVSVAWSCVSTFGLELTVGVSWAVTLDIGGDFAGSVSAKMNMFGNMGGAVAAAASAYLATAYGWDAPFLVVGVLSAIAALLFLGIDASRKLFEPLPAETSFPGNLGGAVPGPSH